MPNFDIRCNTDGGILSVISVSEVGADPPQAPSVPSQIPKNSTIVFAGDSVTQGSLNLTTSPPLYIPQAQRFAQIVGTARGYASIINAGISGSTVASLKARFQADVLSNNPAVVVVMIGINDVTAVPTATPVSAFKSNLSDIVDSIKASGAIPALATPNLIRITSAGVAFPAYLEAVAEIGREKGCAVIPVYDLFCRKFFASTSSEWNSLFYDDKHPSAAGHSFIAGLLLASGAIPPAPSP